MATASTPLAICVPTYDPKQSRKLLMAPHGSNATLTPNHSHGMITQR
jgi:hypothetical protein